ncbi:MAG: hypothetical protein ICV74_03445 [Thermoleophilia bacterium]|nr:hypothetical protein [Thermoleophilia bacterium]
MGAAAPAPVERRRAGPLPDAGRERERAAPRSLPLRARLAGGAAWIVLVAALLAGIVAINVAALRLNLEAQRLEERRDDLRARNGEAASELSSLGSAERVEDVGRQKLGLAQPVETRYVRLRTRSG